MYMIMTRRSGTMDQIDWWYNNPEQAKVKLYEEQ